MMRNFIAGCAAVLMMMCSSGHAGFAEPAKAQAKKLWQHGAAEKRIDSEKIRKEKAAGRKLKAPENTVVVTPGPGRTDSQS